MAAQTVAVLGASHNPDRYSNMAVRRLRDVGHNVIPVAKSLGDIVDPVDTLTLYVGPQRSLPMIDAILRLTPKRVIFNPGTESAELAAALDRANIPHVEACTLVMLQTGQF